MIRPYYKVTWTPAQGWIVYDAHTVTRDQLVGVSIPAVFEAGHGPGASRLCDAWIAANEPPPPPLSPASIAALEAWEAAGGGEAGQAAAAVAYRAATAGAAPE